MESLEAGPAGAVWQAAPAMPSTHPPGTHDGGRFLANAVLLPTGGVLVVGGLHRDTHSPALGVGTFGTPVLQPQIFEDGAWETYPANPSPLPSIRDYHSTAVLLPDARVFIAGGENRNYDYEIWSPPYLDKPQNQPQNVTWVAPAPFVDATFDAFELDRGQAYELQCDPLPFGQHIKKVVLMAPCSVTHHSDMHQRYVETHLERLLASNDVLFRVPATEGEVPSGLYMLFLVTSAPSVSHAQWVLIR